MTQVTSTLEELSVQIRSIVQAGGPYDQQFCSVIADVLALSLNDATWIPSELTVADPEHYRREVMHEDAEGLFTIACLTWAPGQATPIHDHRSWGVIGVAEGVLRSETFDRTADGRLAPRAETNYIGLHSVTMVDPFDTAVPDIHRLASATDEKSVSIHIYGCSLAEINLHRYDLNGQVIEG